MPRARCSDTTGIPTRSAVVLRCKVGLQQRRQDPDDVGPGFVVATLVVAFDDSKLDALGDAASALSRIRTLHAADVIAFEIIWSPSDPDERFGLDALEAHYPELCADG